MFRPKLAVLFAAIIAIACWLISSPAMAQATQERSVPVIESTGESTGGKPLFSFAGKRPTNLGVNQGKLLACPNTPNCVNSQSSDAVHKIEPLTYSSSPAQALANLKATIAALPRTKLITETDDYLYAEFATPLMGFVDDVEFYLDTANRVIHVRSASRLGQSDLGVNRKRVEDIRSKFAEFEANA